MQAPPGSDMDVTIIRGSARTADVAGALRHGQVPERALLSGILDKLRTNGPAGLVLALDTASGMCAAARRLVHRIHAAQVGVQRAAAEAAELWPLLRDGCRRP